MNGSIDFSRPFSYFTEDKNWVSKFVIGAALGLIPIVNFFVGGYMLRLIDSLPQEKNLPQWDDWGTMFRNGFLLFLTLFIYAIPALIIGGIALAFLIPAVIAAQKSGAVGATMFLIPVLIGLFAMLYLLIIYVLTPAIILIFNRNKSVGEALNVGQVFELTRNNFKNIFMIILVFWGVSVAVGIITSIPILGTLLWIAAHFYTTLVVANLYGQLDKIVYPGIGVQGTEAVEPT
ncbi:MAG: DUF4013 domain-containing protein [Actinobacteria bacterium]|nr:MAG: DUF4013 domain-containing protein [Actinomycetota bacterium]